MASNIVRPDSSGRISLARFGVQPGQVYEVRELAQGRISLTPVPTPSTFDPTSPEYNPSEGEYPWV